MRIVGTIVLTLFAFAACKKTGGGGEGAAAGAGSAGSAVVGSAAGSETAGAAAPGSNAAGAGSADTGAAAGSDGAGAAAAAGGAESMAHRAGMCPSTVLGATTTSAVKGTAIVVTVESSDKDAITAIQKRTDELLAEKKDGTTGGGHDQKGSHGGGRGICPIYVPEGATATAKREAKGVVVTITPKDHVDELAGEIAGRIPKAADWVKANVKEGDKGNQGGVGGGKGEDGSNHSGKGDGKGHERKKGGGTGGGKGTGGGGGGGTGGGDGKGGGSGAGSDKGGW